MWEYGKRGGWSPQGILGCGMKKKGEGWVGVTRGIWGVGGKKLVTLLDLCVSSLRRGHANLLCIVPILTDDPRRESSCASLGN